MLSRMQIAFLIVALAATASLSSGARTVRPGRLFDPARVEPSGEAWPRGPRRFGVDVYDIHPVDHLPGLSAPQLAGQTYSGYITVDEAQDRHVFFYMQLKEDPSHASSAPVVVWMNGGPGCSSMEGFIYEHGPYLFSKNPSDPDGLPVLSVNPHGWTKEATVVWVDNPVGVGLSYCDAVGCEESTDSTVARDMSLFVRMLVDFFGFEDNDVYITGESYAGVFVPTVTAALLDGNHAGLQPNVNLKGYVVGNGVTDEKYDSRALFPFAVGKSLISQDLYQRATKACKGQDIYSPTSEACAELVLQVRNDLLDLDVYDVLLPCYHGSATARAASLAALSDVGPIGWPLGPVVRPGPVHHWGRYARQAGAPTVPCTDDVLATRWLNDPAVRQAIHARAVEDIGEWELCNMGINFSYRHDLGSMLPYHAKLIGAGLRALVYSGDHDMAVPHTGSEAWTRDLARKRGLDLVAEWAPWELDGQVAGYCVTWKGLQYVTVKGAGHMVPQTKPPEAREMLRGYLAQDLCQKQAAEEL